MNHNNSATKSQATKYYRVAKMICKKYDLHQFKVTTMDKLSSIRNHVPTPKILSSPSTTIMTNNDRQPHTVQPCTTSGIHTLVWEPQLYTESVLNRKMYLFYTLKKSFIYLYIYINKFKTFFKLFKIIWNRIEWQQQQYYFFRCSLGQLIPLKAFGGNIECLKT